MKKVFGSILLILLVASYAQAQEETDLFEMSLEELMQLDISVGSKTVKNPDQIPGAITVISHEQLEQIQARSLRDVLNTWVPGMDVVPTYFGYGNMVNSGIYSRGILSDFNQQILILYNGQNKFNESTFGSPYPGMFFTLESVERIEINTSPAPLLGGSALTTINIITREGYLNGTEAFANIGFNGEDGFQSKRFTVNHGVRLKEWHLGTSLQYFDDLGQAHPDQQNFGFTNNESQLRDGVQGSLNFLVNVKSPGEVVEFGSWYKNVSRDALFSNLNISASSELYNFQASTLHNYLNIQATNSVEVSAGVSLFDVSNTINLDQPIPVGVNQRINVPSRTELSNYNAYLKVDYLKDYTLWGNHTINAGIKIEREGQSSHAISQLNDQNNFIDVTQQQLEQFARDLPNDNRTIAALYAENNWNIANNLSLLFGFRYDYYDNFGDNEISALNPRIAVAYLPSKKFILKAQYSSAVRPPSLYEIEGNNFLPQLYGNQTLDFESLNTFEFSAKYRTDRFEITVNPYFAQFDNRIAYVPSLIDTTSSVASNSGSVSVLGVEVTTKYEWKKQNYIFLNASQQDSQDGLTDDQTYYIPSTYINGGVNMHWDKINLNVTGNYRGERVLPENLIVNQEVATSSQFLVNTAFTYRLLPNLVAYLQVQNVLNETYFIPLSSDGLYVPLRQRTINIGINLEL